MTVEKITLKAAEKGTYVLTLAFTDEADEALVPKTLSWTLCTVGGMTMASGTVTGDDLGSSVDIVLSGTQLRIYGSHDDLKRRLALSATYDSDYGDDLPLTAECEFSICSFAGIT